MREADKRARITVAYSGLVMLQSQLANNARYKSTRNHLVAVPKNEAKSPEIINAVRRKDWQKDYVLRLVEAGILKKVSEGSQELYYPPDPKEIDLIIADHDKYGLRLSRFLFPREAGIPAELDEDEED